MNDATPCLSNVLPETQSCTIRGEHFTNCRNPTCTGCWPRPATRGEVCERCYANIDHAIGVADQLRALNRTLHQNDGLARAITPDYDTTTIAGPRVPLTPLQLDIEAIDRAQHGNTDATTWTNTQTGAAQALNFTRLVRSAEKAHPVVEHEHKLHRLRCPKCGRATATWRPPAWPGDEVQITCIDTRCGWTATNPNAIEIVTAIEHRGAA